MGLKKLGGSGRRTMRLAAEDLVSVSTLAPGFPRAAQANVLGLRLQAWCEANRELLDEEIQKHGALLFRGFDPLESEGLEQMPSILSTGALEYKERSSPRSRVAGRIYTSTDHPSDQEIFLHNENSYQSVWPMKLFFLCVKAAEVDGATPLADFREIYQSIDPEVKRRFIDRGWMVVRNFGQGFGLPWQTVFGTSDRSEVDAYCHEHGIEPEWRSGDRLRTRAVRRAAATHLTTGESVWFNHATFFHVSTLPEDVQ